MKLADSYYYDMSVIIFQYKDIAYTKITQIPTYPALSLFGDIGGQLGLFIGASLLTMQSGEAPSAVSILASVLYCIIVWRST